MSPDIPYRVCMVCTGNICRSPMAAVVLRRMIDDAGLGHAVEVDSAGTDHWHIGDGADRRALRALRNAGYDGSAHVAAQFDADFLGERDLVLVADTGHLRRLRSIGRARGDLPHVRLLREFDPASVAAGTLEVDDPYYGDAAGFTRCLAEIEAACRGVVAFIRDELTGHKGRESASPE